MDFVGIAGLIVSVGGFTLALWQLGRTKRAAEAARDAAAEAVETVRRVHAVATIEEVCGRSRDLLQLTRLRSLPAAATAAFELRGALSRFRVSEPGEKLQSPELWSNTLSSVASIHERLESAALTNRLDAGEREALIHEIASVHSSLSSLAAHTSGG